MKHPREVRVEERLFHSLSSVSHENNEEHPDFYRLLLL